ncbi:MAG: hypothetical protein J0H87_00035 [Holosporales bacterium]|nr:hypothetical protein [Holosporales bacterium]
MKNDQPTHAIFQVIEREKDIRLWSRIGAAWMHQDGEGFNLVLMLFLLQAMLWCVKSHPRRKGHESLSFHKERSYNYRTMDNPDSSHDFMLYHWLLL